MPSTPWQAYSTHHDSHSQYCNRQFKFLVEDCDRDLETRDVPSAELTMAALHLGKYLR